MKKGRALLKYALHLAVLVGVVWAAVKTIDGEQFREAIVDGAAEGVVSLAEGVEIMGVAEEIIGAKT